MKLRHEFPVRILGTINGQGGVILYQQPETYEYHREDGPSWSRTSNGTEEYCLGGEIIWHTPFKS